jgi:5-methylcytosine-specific restriction endonuclease McrA
MAKPRASLTKPRSIAFHRQQGYCFYCNQPMWTENPVEFVSKYGLTPKQTWYFQCTGEHLKAHSQGGTVAQSNIVAACRFCNQTRHRRKNPPDPIQYKILVHSRMAKGRWHIARLM